MANPARGSKCRSRTALTAAALLFCLAAPLAALDSSDLLFHLSFENGVVPELARGASTPTQEPQALPQRLVEGLIGNGYRFAGKGSTIEYATGRAGGPRGCAEMYGPQDNLFGPSGTVAFWIKPLPNSHNMVHRFFLCWPIQAVRNQYQHHQYQYGQKGGYFYDGRFKHNPWMHFALTWREDEARGYFNGRLATVTPGCGVVAKAKERFEVASEGLTWLDFQTKDFEDDAVMDEFQIFRRPLTEEEIRSLFERGHVTTRQQEGNVPDKIVTSPERAYAGHRFTAPRVPTPPLIDGALDEWQAIPAQGGWIERRLGVLDTDDATVRFACDDAHFYFAFYCQVDEKIRQDPTHVWYPTGQFKAGQSGRDADVYADDYVELSVQSKTGQVFRFAINAKGAILDSRDGDRAWSSDVRWVSRSDFEDWTAELAIPLSELGWAKGEAVSLNVIRSWKLFKSAQNTLCADEQGQPAWGTLTLGGPSAGLASLGAPWQGNLEVSGALRGPPGAYSVRLTGKGHNQDFDTETKVELTAGPTTFRVAHRMTKPGDVGLVIRVLDPAGKEILVRSLPFTYVRTSTVELANYPGWERLEVIATPVDPTEARATVVLTRDGKEVRRSEIPEFGGASQTAVFETKDFEPAEYEVVTTLHRQDVQVGEDRKVYVKKPLPEWYGSRAGAIDGPPVPWKDVRVAGNTVTLLGKAITFDNSLFPSQIVANQQPLLNGPFRLRVTRNGEETLIAAGDFRITDQTRRRASWFAQTKDGELSVAVKGWIEFDSFSWAEMTLSGDTVDRVILEMPLRRKTVTLKTLQGVGLMGDEPVSAPTQYCSYWFGNEQAGFSYYWEERRDWVEKGEEVIVTPDGDDVVIAVPFIQQPVDLAAPRTFRFGWMASPSRPLRKDWREIALYKGVTYMAGDYTFATPNYPKPRNTPEGYATMAEKLGRPDTPIVCWYAFGPFMWVGSPEYAEWYREWRPVPSGLARPDPNSTAWGPACPNSSASNLHMWMLDRFVAEYPQRATYFDCMTWTGCRNEAHGCGYVDRDGKRKTKTVILANRRHYERVYNIMKGADPVYGWVRHHDWGPNPSIASFGDENWLGEGHIGPLGGTPEKNYYRIISLPYARTAFGNEHWGHMTSWLTEMACTAGDDVEKRATFYGKLVRPPQDGKRGEWVLPRWRDYEHVAGLGLIHDLWQIGGNDLQLPWMWLREVQRMMRWDRHVTFVGYWELGEMLQTEGGVPEQIVCSVYYRPPGAPKPDVPGVDATHRTHRWEDFRVAPAVEASLRIAGERPPGWLVLAPMNNSDKEVTLRLKPNLKKLGLESGTRLRDIFRAFDFAWQAPAGWKPNAGDPEAPLFEIKGKEEVFPMEDGAAVIPMPPRTFRMLLLE